MRTTSTCLEARVFDARASSRWFIFGLVAVAGLGQGCFVDATGSPEEDLGEEGVAAEESALVSGQPLAVSGHYLKGATTGAPSFLMVDTAWQLVGRGTRAQIISYLDTRKAQGFNTVMMTLDTDKNAYGDAPFRPRSDGKPDVTKLNVVSGTSSTSSAQYDYWDHTRFAIQSAKERGFNVILTMGGPEFWDYNGDTDQAFVTSPSVAYQYGRNVGSQLVAYKDRLIFNVMDDRNVKYGSVDKHSSYRALAEGLTDGLNSSSAFNNSAAYSRTLMTALPRKSEPSSSVLFPSEAWLDISSTQAWPRDGALRVLADFGKTPVRPTWVLEGRYENYNATWTAWSQRYQAYTSTFAGALGAVYGESAVCIFGSGWQSKMTAPGATQMKHLVKLMGEWGTAEYMARIPDQSLIVSPGQVNATTVGGDLQQATRTALGVLAMVYAMNGRTITVRMSKLAPTSLRAYWYNPRTGRWYKNGTEYGTRTTSVAFATVPSGPGAPDKAFDPPGRAASENDWVLVLRR